MSDSLRKEGVMICCSALKREVESLCRTHWRCHRLVFSPSLLHMHPERMAASLESVLETELGRSRGVVMIYGDCCARMTALEALPMVARTKGKNCFELLLGHDEYHRLSHEGAFFIVPEWGGHWKEVFFKGLGLNSENVVGLMRKMHNKLIYLDTGLVQRPEKDLCECAEFLRLPYESLSVSLEHLRATVEEALLRCITKVFLLETKLSK